MHSTKTSLFAITEAIVWNIKWRRSITLSCMTAFWHECQFHSIVDHYHCLYVMSRYIKSRLIEPNWHFKKFNVNVWVQEAWFLHSVGFKMIHQIEFCYLNKTGSKAIFRKHSDISFRQNNDHAVSAVLNYVQVKSFQNRSRFHDNLLDNMQEISYPTSACIDLAVAFFLCE